MLSSVSNSQCTFCACVHDTRGKEECDRLAHKLSKSENPEKVAFAKRYFDSIEELKKPNAFDEIILLRGNRMCMPTVNLDGYNYTKADSSVQAIKPDPEENNDTYLLMAETISAADYVKTKANNSHSWDA